jgi:predicted nucleic acid-binding protein
MEIVIDTSAIIAAIADEPDGDKVINLTENAILVCPSVVPFEISNALTRMIRKNVIDKDKMTNLIKSFQKIPIKLFENNLEDVLEIGWDYKIYAYDAFFLDTAKSLNLPLLTLDDGMEAVGKKLGVKILSLSGDRRG